MAPHPVAFPLSPLTLSIFMLPSSRCILSEPGTDPGTATVFALRGVGLFPLFIPLYTYILHIPPVILSRPGTPLGINHRRIV
jgi:hypothetical protein